MRIVAIRDIVSPIRSNIANAYIDFSQMTASVVAVETDLKVEGKPVIGYGFNSNGRYAQKGLLGERFIPRLKQAKPDSLLDAEGLLDPAKCWAAMMANEKPGGHGERSVAVGVLDMALWDAVAKAKRVPLWKLLADRYNGGKFDDKAWVYAAGGYYYPGKDLDGLQDEMKHYLDLGYSCVKMKVGGVPLADDLKRIEAVLKIVGAGDRLAVDVNGKFDLPTAIAFGKAIEGFGLRWYEEPLDPLDYLAHGALATQYAPPLATGENLFSMQDARNLVRHARPPARPRHPAIRPGPVLRPGRVPAHHRHAEGPRLVAAALRAARRPPVRAQHRRRPAMRRQRILSRRSSRRSAASPTIVPSSTAAWRCPTRRASASNARPTCGPS